MQYIQDNILCLSYKEFVPAIMSKGIYDGLKDRGNITVHGLGGRGRTVYIEYESIKNVKYKHAVLKLYGDPYAYASSELILKNYQRDLNAQEFYMGYVLPNGEKLPNKHINYEGKEQINYVERYTIASSWLNLLIRLTTDKIALKRELNITIGAFWVSASLLIKTKNIALPGTAKHLRAKIKAFQNEGYASLVETHKFGNGFSKKIADDTAEALLKEMLAAVNKHSDVTISEQYNLWASETSRKTITPEAVGYRRKMWATELLFEREGLAKTNTLLSKQGKRKRPSAPLLLVNSDDNVMDVFFRVPAKTVKTKDKGLVKIAKNDWFRPALYVVIDAYNDYILGYACGETVTIELVKEAYRNAQRNVARLTGDSYVWQQIVTDHWGISGKNTTDLEHFYNSMGVFTPAALKNSQSKYVERSFGTTWHKNLKKIFPSNYSGHNLTAKQKLNPDAKKPKNFPVVEQAPQMIHNFIESMRQTKRKDCELTREQEWVQAFNNSDKSKKRCLNEDMRLQIFGKQHKDQHGKLLTNTVTSSGIMPTLLGEKRIYEFSQKQVFEHIGKKLQVVYDEQDLSTVLLTDGKGTRFTVDEYKLLPSAIADYEEGDALRIKGLLEEKRTLMPLIQQAIAPRKELLERARIDAESRLQAGVLVKEITHVDQKIINAVQHGAAIDELELEEEVFDIFAQRK